MKKVMAILLCVALVSTFVIPVKATNDTYFDKFGITYEQLFTLYPNYLSPSQETAVVNSFIKAYSATLGEYGEEHDFLPSFIYALDEGGANILASEILAQFGIGKSLEETLIANTSEALIREILQKESELASVTDEISSNFSQLKSIYDVATVTGKIQFLDDLKSSCKHLSNSDLDKLADELFKKEKSLISKIGDGVEFWQLIVSIVELHDLQAEAICQLRDALKDNSDFAKALDNLLLETEKDPVSYMLEYYCTDEALELLSDAIQNAFIEMVFSPSKLVVATANIVIKVITKAYSGAMADEIYQTTLLSAYVSEFSAAIDSHRTQFALAKVQGKPLGQDDIAEYRYLYSAYITTIRETLKSALDTAKTDIQEGNVQKAIDLCDKFTYETYIAWCMTAVKADIDAGVVAAPGGTAENITACVQNVYPSYGKLVITKESANIMDRPCSVDTDVNAKKIDAGVLNAEYTVTGLYLNTANNYWYQIVTNSGTTGYIYSGNCEHRAYLQDARVTGLDVPTQIDVGSRYYIKGTISTVYTNLVSISYLVYDEYGNRKTGGTVDVSGKSYVLDNSAIDTAAEFNLLEAGTYHCLLEATVDNYSASECYRDTVLLDTKTLVVGNTGASAGNPIQADGADFITRSDGVWLWPTTEYHITDWAGCYGSPSNNGACPLHNDGRQCGYCAADHYSGFHTPYGHNGLDIGVGLQPVYAMADGTVVACVQWKDDRGNYVMIRHDIPGEPNWYYYSVYQHLDSISVSNGAKVTARQQIAISGNTGLGTGDGYHLHVGLLLGNSSAYTDPYSLEVKGWVTTAGYQEGRIVLNPALNTDIPFTYYDASTRNNVIGHAGSVVYTTDPAEVIIGEKATVCSHSYTATETHTSCTENGTRKYTCTACGDTYSEPIEPLGHNYVGATTDATCISAGYTTYTCSRCNNSYVEKADGWSGWSTEYPTGIPDDLVEEKIQYSYLVKECTTSENDTLEGWTFCGTTFSEWGAVQTTTNKPAESDALRITNTAQTGWGYYHWCNYYYNGGNNWNVDSIEYGSPCYCHWYTSSIELPAISFPDKGNQQAYGGTGSGASPCAYNFYIWFRDTSADIYTYSYQTRSEVYQFYRWSDKWSDWSDEEVTANEDRQVKKQTVYRYYIGELADHKYENGVCSVCGHKTFIAGDIDGDDTINHNDAIYLLLYTMFGEEAYPLNGAGADIDGNGTVDQEDAIYLLLHTMFGESFYPLKKD